MWEDPLGFRTTPCRLYNEVSRYKAGEGGGWARLASGCLWRLRGCAEPPAWWEKVCKSRSHTKGGVCWLAVSRGCKSARFLYLGEMRPHRGELSWFYHFRRERRDGFPGNWPGANLTPSEVCRMTGNTWCVGPAVMSAMSPRALLISRWGPLTRRKRSGTCLSQPCLWLPDNHIFV